MHAHNKVKVVFCRNKALTAKLLRQGYRYFKVSTVFSKFYGRHSTLVEKYNVALKTLLQQGISEPEFILLTVLRRWSRCWSYSLLLYGLLYEAVCFMFCLVLVCACVFSPFSNYLTWGRES